MVEVAVLILLETLRTQDPHDGGGDPAPFAFFPRQLLAPLRSQCVKPRLAVVVGRASFGGHEVTCLESLERGVERAMVHDQDVVGLFLDRTGDSLAVQTPENERSKNQPVAGVYGVLAFTVARQSKELALRIAIGAGPHDIVRLVTVQSLRFVTLGLAVGIGFTFVLSRIVRASGEGGSVLDPRWPAFATPVVIIGVIGVAATFVPSRRALRVNPAELLWIT